MRLQILWASFVFFYEQLRSEERDRDRAGLGAVQRRCWLNWEIYGEVKNNFIFAD